MSPSKSKSLPASLIAFAKPLLMASLAAITAIPTHADVLVGYNIDNFTGTDSLTGPAYELRTIAVPGSFTDPRLQPVALSVGPSYAPVQQSGFYRFVAGLVPTTPIVSGNYMEFTVEPRPGFALSLDTVNSVQMYSRIYDADLSASVFIRSSLDNFSTTLDTFISTADGQVRSFNLPGFTAITTAVTFRVYLYDSDGSAGWAVRSGSNLGTTGNLEFVINGTLIDVGVVAATGVAVTPESAALLVNETLQLTTTVAPSNASFQSVTWTSSNEAVATVSTFGLVTAITEGTAILTATTDDGGFQDSCVVTVSRLPVTAVSVAPDNLTMDIGALTQLTASITPVEATYSDISWSSDDPTVATVSASGLVTAVTTGTATITVTTDDGDFTAGCAVTVTTHLAAGIGIIDANGWTRLSPSPDSRLVYVSSSEGDDTNNGLTPATPKATIDAANSLIRDGFPDWLMLKRGDTFPQPNLGRWKSGRNANEPMVLTYYGDSGPRPVIKVNDSLVDWNARARHHLAFVGLDVYRSISDPDSPEFNDSSSSSGMSLYCGSSEDAYNLLIEDCRFRYCGLTVMGDNLGPFVHNANIRRNIVMNVWTHGSTDDSAIIFGMFMRGVVGISIEENLFHHNGWSEVIADANANQFNHNIYLQRTNDGPILVRGNILSFGAAHGLQLRSGGTADMNAFVGNAIGMNVGYSTPPAYFTGQTFVNDNVVTDGRPQIPDDNSNPQTAAIWGIWRQSISNFTINDNIVANILDTRAINMRPYQDMAANQFGTGNIGWGWVNTNDPSTDPGWLDPTRNAASFATANGWGDWNGFIAVAANRGLREMPFGLTAYTYVDYIREGFSKSPVNPPYEYDVPAFTPATVTLDDLNHTFDGTPKTVAATTDPASLSVLVTYGDSTTGPTNAGSYAVLARIATQGFTGTASGTLVIAPATASVTLSDLNYTYDGTPKSATVTTVPTGLAANVTYAGVTSAPINAGSYGVFATVVDSNHIGSAGNTLTIAPAPATLTLGDLRQAYDGTPKVPSATSAPTDLDVVFTYDGSLTAPTLPGSYAVVAVSGDQNYRGSTSGELAIVTAALVRHGPTLNGDIDGSVQVLLAENVTLNGGSSIEGDLLVPGTPNLKVNGNALYAGVLDGFGNSAPTSQRITLNGNSVLRYIVRRVDPIDLPVVSAPPSPAGTVNITLNNSSQGVTDWSTLRDLTLNGNAGIRSVPPGTYGSFTANGNSGLILGVPGATEPAVYNLQNLKLNGNSEVQIVGPVILTLAQGVALNGSIGDISHPEWLLLRIADGGLTLNGNVALHGIVQAPNGPVTINGNSLIQGEVAADRLTLNGNGYLVQP